MHIKLAMKPPVVDQTSRFVLRLGLGIGLSVAVAYGLPLSIPHVSLLMVVLLLGKAGPPLPLAKSIALAGTLIFLTGAGILLVPLLENYAFTAILLIALVLFAIFYLGTRTSHPLLSILIVTFTLIPVAGVQDQALALDVIKSLSAGIILAAVSGMLAYFIWPDIRLLSKAQQEKPNIEAASWIALRGVTIVLPVFILALQNPSLYMAAIMKTATLGQQAGPLSAKEAGRELLGSTFLGALMALLIWLGLSLWPSLWMYALWVVLVFLWLGLRLYRPLPRRHPPSFWMNSMITLVIFLGPAVQDSANGKDVLSAALIRLTLFAGVALYAWLAIYTLERCKVRLRPTLKG